MHLLYAITLGVVLVVGTPALAEDSDDDQGDETTGACYITDNTGRQCFSPLTRKGCRQAAQGWPFEFYPGRSCQ